MFQFKIKKNRGFALLFSVLISSFLLTIGLSIFSIALKELSISTAARQSIHAFFAADSGRECAIYWDLKGDKIPTLQPRNSSGIECNGPITEKIDMPDYTGQDLIESEFYFLVDQAGGPNTDVKVTKYRNSAGCPANKICTTVTAVGHDSTGGDRVERAIVQTY